jgi:hypothetical protein
MTWQIMLVLWFILKSVLVVRVTFENPFGNYCLKNTFQCLKSEKSLQKFRQTGTKRAQH